MKVKVRLYGHLEWYSPGGRREHELEVPDGSSVGDVIRALGLPPAEVALVSVNGDRAEEGRRLRDGDELRILPVVSGGSDRVVRAALIQMRASAEVGENVERAVALIREAARRGAEVVCLQEMFNTQYFCATHDPGYYEVPEPIPGPTVSRMMEVAREEGVVVVAPVAEVERPGVFYNSAAVIDSDGTLVGKYRKNHIPHTENFWEKYYFRPGNLGFPVFRTAVGVIGVFIDYDRHFPESARILALQGAEILFNPCATVADLSKYLWFLEQRADAVANGVFIGCVNRVGKEERHPGVFYGSSYFCDPYGEILAQGSEDRDEVVVADLDLKKVWDVRNTWQFFRDRRPNIYRLITEEDL